MAARDTNEIGSNVSPLRQRDDDTESGQSLQQLMSRNRELDKEIAQLQNEVSQYKELLQSKEQDEQRFKNASRDARKMYGDVTPGDITHQDVKLEYTNHFKQEHRNLPRALGAEGQQKYQVWQLSADIVKESFEVNKQDIVGKVMRDMKDTLNLAKEQPGIIRNESHEKNNDLYRAFQEVIKNMSKEKREEVIAKVLCNSEDPKEKEACDLLIDAIIEFELADYQSFVKSGKMCDRYTESTEVYGSRV